MAIEANLGCRLDELRVVLRAMHIVAGKACKSAAVHHTLRKIVSLHAVLVRGTIGKMRKAHLPQRMIFKLPKIL